MICKDDASLGDSLIAAIQRSDRVYFEVDMDNLMEMLSALKDFKMRNDTTLADLLSKEDYEKVKDVYGKQRRSFAFFTIGNL